MKQMIYQCNEAIQYIIYECNEATTMLRLHIIIYECNEATTMLRLHMIIYECNEATKMLRLHIIIYECNEATMVLQRLCAKKQISAELAKEVSKQSSQEYGTQFHILRQNGFSDQL